MIPESIRDKIAKLLRLAKSSNAHEAGLAMANAAKLAAKHSIDLADCEGIDEVPDVIVSQVEDCPLRLRREWRLALSIVSVHFHVTAVLGHGRVTYFGREEDIAIATALHAFMVSQCRKGLATFEADEQAHRRRMTSNKRDNYIDAWFNGVNSKLLGQMEVLQVEHTRLAIVLADAKAKRDEAKNAHFGAANIVYVKAPPAPKRRNVSARVAGFVDGRQTQLLNELQAPTKAEPVLALS